ncbi:22995_t:CDS:1, partial [Gigaspora margarita]
NGLSTQVIHANTNYLREISSLSEPWNDEKVNVFENNFLLSPE